MYAPSLGSHSILVNPTRVKWIVLGPCGSGMAREGTELVLEPLGILGSFIWRLSGTESLWPSWGLKCLGRIHPAIAHSGSWRAGLACLALGAEA